jgi:hypothetical protein
MVRRQLRSRAGRQHVVQLWSAPLLRNGAAGSSPTRSWADVAADERESRQRAEAGRQDRIAAYASTAHTNKRHDDRANPARDGGSWMANDPVCGMQVNESTASASGITETR